MTFYDTLLDATRDDRDRFLANPAITRGLAGAIAGPVYAAYLIQAWHHVRYTCPLLALAASRCGLADAAYAKALYAYIDEERGHDDWILDDLSALGVTARPLPPANIACRAMVGYVHYAIEHESPYAMLGMVHVLEGMSTALAERAAKALAATMGLDARRPGFRYLTSHGAIDQEHVAFFRDLVNQLADPAAKVVIVETARVVYKLYGDLFTEVLATATGGTRHAA